MGVGRWGDLQILEIKECHFIFVVDEYENFLVIVFKLCIYASFLSALRSF